MKKEKRPSSNHADRASGADIVPSPSMGEARGGGEPAAPWLRKTALTALALVATVLLGAFAAERTAMHVIGPPKVDGAVELSKVVLDRNGHLLRAFTATDGRWRLPVSHQDVDPRYIKMLIAFEDRRFFDHGGVDTWALMRAASQYLANGRIVSGGSTLTMQVARVLTGRHRRNAFGKFTQIIHARHIEQRYTKHEVLDLYLRKAPFGGNIEGLRAASLAYFGKEPKRLSIGQAALLVALPQSPEARRPDRHPGNARRARDRVLDRVAGAGVISKAEAERAKSERVPRARRPFPKHAPHLADAVLAAHPESSQIKLTINRSIQSALETLAGNHAGRLGPKLSVAILAIDHTTGETLAHIGSAGYLDTKRLGAIDMTGVIRSPGSTLKPVIYGLGFEAGLAHPETLIEDRRTRFGAYRPENFDQTYRGTVTMREALGHSLNVPAVRMLDAVGPVRLVQRMKKFNTSALLPDGTEPSLAVALGGIGMTLKDLATIYTGIANGGRYVHLTHMKGERQQRIRQGSIAAEQNRKILSPLAAWYVTDILKDAPPPPNARKGRIAYKTGTSYGYRDALAVGFDGRHTIAVWVGRADATSTPGLIGRTAAAPILFDAFSRVSQRRTMLPKAPASALQVSSGADLPPPLKRFGARPHADPQSPFIEPPVLIAFPPDRAVLEVEDEPAADTAPMTGADTTTTAITGSEPRQEISPILLKAEGGALPLTWLIDGKPVSAPTNRRKTIWHPSTRGFAKLTVIDARGRADRVTIRLK